MGKRKYLWETDPELALQLLDQTLGWKYSRGSNVGTFWVCGFRHIWYTSFNNRSSGKGCPYCSGNKVWVGFNDLWTTHPDVAQQLVNSEDGYRVSSGSNKKLDWFCGRGHNISVQVVNVVNKKPCHYCSNKKVLVGFNDLWTTDPDLAVQLLDQTDGFRYTRGSDRKSLLWLCRKNHIWKATPNNRTGRFKTGCPKCFGRISKPETAIIECLYEYSPIQQYKVSWFIPDIYIEKFNLIIEYDGSWFHRNTLERDENKTRILLDLGYKVVRVRESNDIALPLLRIKDSNLLQYTYKYKSDLSGLDVICGEILDWISIEK